MAHQNRGLLSQGVPGGPGPFFCQKGGDTIFPDFCRFDSPAQEVGHELHPVANSKDGNPERKNTGIHGGRSRIKDRSRSARENNGQRISAPDLFSRFKRRMNF